jgi:hypothetical protein
MMGPRRGIEDARCDAFAAPRHLPRQANMDGNNFHYCSPVQVAVIVQFPEQARRYVSTVCSGSYRCIRRSHRRHCEQSEPDRWPVNEYERQFEDSSYRSGRASNIHERA